MTGDPFLRSVRNFETLSTLPYKIALPYKTAAGIGWLPASPDGGRRASAFQKRHEMRQVRISECLRSKTQEAAHSTGLALADNELLIITERDQPPLAGQCAHLADVIDVDQRIAMDSAETRVAQLFL